MTTQHIKQGASFSQDSSQSLHFLEMKKKWRPIVEKLIGKWQSPPTDIADFEYACLDRFYQKLLKNPRADRVNQLKFLQQICSDIEDLKLLETNSQLLVQKYQTYVKHIVQEGMGQYLNEDRKSKSDLFYWLIENINARLTEKLILGKLNFKKQSLFSVYFYRVIKNAFIDEIRKLPKESSLNQSKLDVYSQSAIGKIKPQQNYNCLSNLLLTEFQSQDECSKFVFCTKAYYRVVFSESDIKQLFPKCNKTLRKEIVAVFGHNYSRLSKGDLWKKLNAFCEQLCEKKQTIRTTKDWIRKHRNSLLRYLLKDYPIYIPSHSTGKMERALDEYFEHVVHSGF